MAVAVEMTVETPASTWRPRPYFRPSPIRQFPRRSVAQNSSFHQAGGMQCTNRRQAFDAVVSLGGARIELIRYRNLVMDGRNAVVEAIQAGGKPELLAGAWSSHEYWVGRLEEIREEVKRIRGQRFARHIDMEPLP